jgi:hypothetical protein
MSHSAPLHGSEMINNSNSSPNPPSSSSPSLMPNIFLSSVNLPSYVGSNEKRKRTRPWTPDEDTLIIELVRQQGGAEGEVNGQIRWLEIGQMLNGRTGKQCRERW